ncbi:RraA family protein [Pseudaminobacter soli (ex Li et al. 2025)]|uniref:Putative 4-hydroxy-4-methyl-2-oxoglutarate aldolase n=1 Tax=Pseudaminobacter soli (ex Li et al. 2025) TaxID=1295366 RepID=A0A2P7S0Q8_9HYPH|nr:dimethylmenaquinone methyltransferase [Mesorhizobium soli]PSJ56055.1 dimethylmenaquinone methyltransferase [Mesorhizobium soli]
MAFQRVNAPFRKLSDAELDAWRAIPPAVASDCLNRTQAMSAVIKPVSSGITLCGQARTVTAMAGDCGSICELIGIAEQGEVIVVDAGGVEDTAVWGGIMTAEAAHRQLGGAVVFGAIRDVEEVRQLSFNIFCKSVVPRGPHHGFGGIIDAAISVAGAVVRPGDIVLGNDDGVVIVPLERAEDILAAAEAHLIKEKAWLEGIRNGRTIQQIFNMPTSAQ